MAQPRSYREADAEEEGIKGHYAALERARRERLSWQELVLEGLVAEGLRLNAELEKLRTIAARIPSTENHILYHSEKIAKWKAEHGL